MSLHLGADALPGPLDLLKPDTAHLQLALHASGTGLWTWDLRTDEVSWSAECYRIHGVSPDEKPERAREFFDLVHPEDQARVETTVRDAIARRTLYECEFRIVRPAGESVWVQNRGRVVDDGHGRPVLVMGTIIDISARKRAEAAEREVEVLYRTLAAQLPGGAVFVVGPDLRYRLAEGGALAAAGASPQDFEGQRVQDRVPHPFTEQAVADYTLALAGVPFRREHVDAGRHYLTHGGPMRDESGRVVGAIAVSCDITERKKAEDALRDSTLRLRLAQQVAQVGSFEWDAESDVNTWSAEIELLHGLQPGTFGGRFEDWAALLHPEDRERAVQRVRDALRTGELEAEWRIVRPDGEVRWLAARARVFQGPHRGASRMVGVNVDVTAQRRTEQALKAVEREAEDALERVQLALDAGAIIGTWVWEVSQDRFFADERFARSFGVDPKRCREGLPIAEVMESIHPEDLERVGEAVNEALARGGPYRCEYRVRREDGRFYWVEANGRVELGADGSALRFPGVLIDADERRRAEAERERAYFLLRTFIEAVPGVVYAKDCDGRMLLANRGTAELVGKPLEVIIGHTDLEFLEDKAQAAIIMDNDRRIMAAGEPERLEEAVRLPDGSEAWWLSSKAPLRDDAGTVIGLIGASVNITDRKRATQALRARESELQTLADNMPDVLARFDRELRHVFVNAAVERATGRRREDFIGRTNRDLGMPPELCDRWDTAMRGVFERNAPATLEFAFDGPAGRRHFLSRLMPEPDARGRVHHVVAIVSDVTAEKKVEAGLHEANRRKDEFLATLAHELRNPLAPIRNSVQLLQRLGTPTPHAARAVDILDRQVGHLVRLVDDLLDVARIGQGKVNLEWQEVDVRAAVESALDASRPLLDAGRHQVEVTMPVQPLRLRADPTRLEQVLVNLLNNAAKYTPPGGLLQVRAGAEVGWVVISVKDNGSGIPPEMQARVFDLFEQVREHASQAQGGLGIGLSLVRRLVEMHGGTVAVQSDGPGCGSTFTVRLPMDVQAHPNT